MNWPAFWQIIAACAIASALAAIAICLIERGVHPAWIAIGIFLGVAIAAGAAVP